MDKEEQDKFKVSSRKVMIKSRNQWIAMELKTEKKERKINGYKSWFFKKSNKTNKPQSRLIKEKKGER